MGCGCKQKRKEEAEKAQQANRIIVVENGEVKNVPPSPVPPAQEVNNIVEKLNEILP